MTRRYLPFAKRKGTRTSEASSQGMPLSLRERPRVTRRYLPFAKRKGTRASEARSQGMPAPDNLRHPTLNQIPIIA